MARIDRFFKILVNAPFTSLGRMDILRVVWARRKKENTFRSIRLRVGNIFVDGQNGAIDFQVFGQVFLDEVYSRVCLCDNVIVDLGAHKGYFAAFALSVGARAVFCYEPEPTNFACLSRFAETARLNGKTIEVFHAAAGAADGDVTLYTSDESWRHTTIAGQAEAKRGRLQVPCHCLSSILAEVRKAFPEANLVLKVDAEGAECPILLHSPEECFASIREIVFEYHSFAECELRAIRTRIEGLGFEYTVGDKDSDLHMLRQRSTSRNR
jgi:FkbM family methyltransferase